jgi:hypothetical protein
MFDPLPHRERRPLRRDRWILLQLLEDDRDRLLELRVVASDHLGRRLVDLDVGRDADVLDPESFRLL